jgi:hypothetical protein
MEFDNIVEGITADLRRAGAIGGEETARIADLLVAGVEPSIWLHLLEALYRAARELEESAPGVSIEIRLEGRNPVLSLVREEPEGSATEGESLGDYSEDDVLRITLRLPEGLKVRVEEAAARAGASVNAWIVAALARSFDVSASTWTQPGGRMPRRMTGFVKG